MSCVCTYAPIRFPYVGNESSQRIIADCPQRQRNTLRHPERAAANIRGTVWRRFGIGLRCLLAYNGLHRPVSLSREPIPVFTVTPLRAGRRPWRDCLRKGQSLVSGEHFMFGTTVSAPSSARMPRAPSWTHTGGPILGSSSQGTRSWWPWFSPWFSNTGTTLPKWGA